MGTEYYDSQNKTEISQYYIDKTTSLITDTSFSNLLQEGDIKFIQMLKLTMRIHLKI